MQTTIRAAVAAAALAASGASLAQLAARDINGDGSIDAFYDSVQNLTWLADATFAATTLGVVNDFRQPGEMTVQQSNAWASQLDIYGVTDWRLPVSFVPDVQALCDAGSGPACTGQGLRFDSELSRLYDQVGTASPFLNSNHLFWTGNYWTGAYSTQQRVIYFSFGSGSTGSTDETGVPGGHAWAVRDGDVAVSAVPEPSTYALMLAGLGAVGFIRRMRS